MNVPARLGLYGLGLVVAFGAALGVGTLVGPLLPDNVIEIENRAEHDPADGRATSESTSGTDDQHDGPAAATPGEERR